MPLLVRDRSQPQVTPQNLKEYIPLEKGTGSYLLPLPPHFICDTII